MANRWKQAGALLLTVGLCANMMPSMVFAAAEGGGPATGTEKEMVTKVAEETQTDDTAGEEVQTDEAAVMVYAKATDEIPISEETFPDQVFRAYVEEQFDSDDSKTLSEDEISAAVCISIGNLQSFPDISTLCYSLSGIEYFTELEELDCSGNMLQELDLSSNTKLRVLHCDSNLNRDQSDARYGERLEILDISNNTALEELSCYNNSLGELDLSGKSALKELNCENNLLDTLDLSDCVNLTYLACSNNPYLEDLNVSNLGHLQTLLCFIAGLDYDYAGIASLTLGDLPELTRLDVANNMLEELDLSGCPNLTSLNCSSNSLTELDLGNQERLDYVNIGNQWQAVYALASEDKLAVSLEGYVSPENLENVFLEDPNVSLEGNYLIVSDMTIPIVDYFYTTPYDAMDVHLYIIETYQIDVADCVVTIPSCTYDGNEQTPAITVADGDRILTEGTDYTLSFENNINAGIAKVIITGEGFCTGQISQMFKIKKADIKTAATASTAATDLTYNAARQTASIVVTAADGTVLSEGVDYVLDGQTAKAAGTHKAMISGVGNYTGSMTVKYKIAKDAQKLTVKVKKNGTQKYTIKASKLREDSRTFKLKVSKKGKMKVRYSCNNSKIKVNRNGKVTLKKGLKKGTYKIKVTTGASKNYKASKNPKYITVKVK